MLDHWFSLRFVEDAGVNLHCGNEVWVDVGGRSSVLNVALSVCVSSGSWDTEGGSSVSDSEGEFANVRRFVVTGHSLLVIVTV